MNTELFGLIIIFQIIQLSSGLTRHDHHLIHHSKNEIPHDLSLWINEDQVRAFSGFNMKIYAIDNARVSPHIKDPNFNQYLPVIPSEVGHVNFTWTAGSKKYYYNFDRLQSWNENILKPPTISIKTKGKIPREPKQFSVLLPCSGNMTGVAMFSIGLLIQTRKGKPVAGMPLRLNLRKECENTVVRGLYDEPSLASSSQGFDPECDKKCNGWCQNGVCQCTAGYMGQYCQIALCYPQCMNGGTCSSPGNCSCIPGYQGRHCEGGICSEKCLNGGKCVQKDKCECTKGYYGLRCEFSKCVIPCMNGGKCKGINKCRCPHGTSGDHCEIGRRQRSTCKKPCRHGVCLSNHTCLCDDGFHGKYCNQRDKRNRRKLPRR